MRTIVKGKNVEVPDRVRDYTVRKLGRLERLLDDRTDATVEFSNEHHRSASDAHIAEVTLVIDGQTLRSHAVGISYQAALDNVVDKVERQAVAHKSKPRVHARSKEACEEAIEAIAEETGLTDPSRRAVLYSTYEFKKIRLMYFTPEYREWEDLALAGAPLPRWRGA